MYGIPNMKLDKRYRRTPHRPAARRGRDVPASTPVGDGSNGSLDVEAPPCTTNDAVLFATGATVARDLPIPGRELSRHPLRDGVPARQHEEPARLEARRRQLHLGEGQRRHRDRRRRHRHGLHRHLAAPRLPFAGQFRDPAAAAAGRAADNPWPKWPKIFRVDYGHEEAAKRFGADPRVYSISGKVVRRQQTADSPACAPPR